MMRGDILDVIEIWKLQKPSIYTAEIRERLFLEGTCTQYNLPSIDTINKSLQNKIGMSRKKISSIPSEYVANTDKVDEYLAITSHVDPTSLHFF